LLCDTIISKGVGAAIGSWAERRDIAETVEGPVKVMEEAGNEV